MSTQNGYDSFVRANQSGTFGTATDGQTYTQARGNQTLSISSNEGVMTYNGSLTTGVVTMGSTKVGDGIYVVRCTQTSTSDIMGIAPRFKDSNNFYSFVQGATVGQFQLRLDNAGTFSTVAGVGFTSTVGTFYWIKCAIIGGNNFFGKIWADGTAEPNTWQIGALGTTDSSIAGPQSFGLVGTPNTTSNTVSFDHFYAIDYTNSDSIPVADLGGSLEQWAIESLSTTDTGGSLQEWGQDGLTASDTGGSLQEWGQDGLSIIDTGGSLQAWGQDGLAPGDSPSSFMDTTGLIDGNTTTDQGNLAMWAGEMLTIVDSAAYTDSTILVNGLVSVDVLLASDTESAPDALTVVDASSTFADTLTATEGTSILDSALYTDTILTSDGLTTSDAGGLSQGITNNAMSGEDDLIVTDIGSLLSWTLEALTAIDTNLVTDGASLVDALSTSDQYASSLTPLFVDTDIVSDATLPAGSTTFVDASTCSDVLLASGSTMPADTLTPQDSFLGSGMPIPVDILIPADQMSISIILVLVESGTVLDTGNTQRWGIDAPVASDSGGLLIWPVDLLIANDSTLFVAGVVPVEQDTVSDAGSGLVLSPVAMIYVTFTANLPNTNFNVSLPNTNFTVTIP